MTCLYADYKCVCKLFLCFIFLVHFLLLLIFVSLFLIVVYLSYTFKKPNELRKKTQAFLKQTSEMFSKYELDIANCWYIKCMAYSLKRFYVCVYIVSNIQKYCIENWTSVNILLSKIPSIVNPHERFIIAILWDKKLNILDFLLSEK